MTAGDVIDKLARGDVYVVPVTFPEGPDHRRDGKDRRSQGLWTGRGVRRRSSRYVSPIRALDPAARDLEGYLFPETYPLSRHADARGIVRLMTDAFDRALSPELRAAARARGLSIRQLVTLASIVEKETAKPEERPLVASVYENRLRIGMALQCDPTVIYALEQAGRYHGNLHHDDLSFDSPYNTYRYPGSAARTDRGAGPRVARSRRASGRVDYLYFVSRNDGSHEFATTLDEHNRNVQKYQVEYFREIRAGGVGTGGKDRTGRPLNLSWPSQPTRLLRSVCALT